MNETRAEAIYAYIKAHPGRSAYQVAEALNMPESTVRNALAATERLGLLLYEDGRGRLYVHEELRTRLAQPAR